MPVTRRNKKSEDEQPPSKEIDLTKIKDLIKLMEDHDLTAFELEDSGFKVRLEKGGNQEQIVAAPQPVATEEKAPEKIVADLEGLNVGDTIHISSIELPENCIPTISDRDFTVATIASPRGGMGEDDEEVETSSTDEKTEESAEEESKENE